jgi:hypothetical protein
MPEEPTIPPPPGDEPPRRYAVQDRRIAERIARRRGSFERVLADAEAVALFAKEGFKEPRLQAALGLCTAAQGAYDDRLTALDEKDRASKAFRKQDADARRAYGDLRGAVLSEYRDAATRRALGVLDEPADDLEQFLTEGHALLAVLDEEPHATALDASHGYTAQRRAGVRADLDALRAADTAHAGASDAAKVATRARDAAYRAMMEEADKFNRAVPRALREHPHIRTRLGL